ncbi:hypothetical protein K3495_g1890 [Podosphaera aphanis]|nr:hypothetical protein K3495_g1890 [Podosphaera aphanis]
MADSAPKSYSMDPTLWMYTSLTAGSSHIITATSRMETILKANRIPFKALDIATDEKARMLWGRRAGKDESGRPRKIPGLVQMGMVIGDIVEVEDWNEYGELKQHIKIVPIPGAPLPPIVKPLSMSKSSIATQENDKLTSHPSAGSSSEVEISNRAITPVPLALRQVGQQAAQKAAEKAKATNMKGLEIKLDKICLDETVGAKIGSPNKPMSKTPPEPKNTSAAKLPEKSPTESTPDVSLASTFYSKRSPTDPLSSLHSPTSPFSELSHSKITSPRHSIDRLESIQSPNSTAWKPASLDQALTKILSGEKIGNIELEKPV